MIPLDVTTAVFLYLTFSLGSVFLLWIFFEGHPRVETDVESRREIWHCRICTYTYVDSTHDTISACPRCRSLNRKEEQAAEDDH